MATAASAREARRKRIMERGSDRLALISGHIHTLPSSPPPEPSFPPPSQPQELDPSLSSQLMASLLSNQTTVSSNGKDKHSSSMLPTLHSKLESGLGSIDSVTERIEPLIRKSEISTEAFGGPTSDHVSDREQPAVIQSSVENSGVSSGSNQWSGHASNRSFSPKQIVSAIRASEITRMVCSITIALLVVLSHAGFPLLRSSFVKSFIFSRPLFLVLLTNVTVVIALLLEKDEGLQQADKETLKVTPEDGYGWAEQVSKSLEAGMLLQKVIDALSMDCSAYALVVISGLSLVSKLS